MKFRSDKVLVSVAAVLAMAAAGSANATNGYLTHGVGTKSKGVAGSGVADPQEVAIVASNPAGIAFVGERLEVGISAFAPMRDYKTTPSLLPDAAYSMGAFTVGNSTTDPRTGNSISSENELFFIPYVAKSWKNGEQGTIALSFYARGGMNTEWQGGFGTFDPDGPGPAPTLAFPGTYGGSFTGNEGTAGVDLMQGFLNTAYAWNNPARTVSVGAAAIVGIQRFRAIGVAAFAPYTKAFAESGGAAFPQYLSNNGYDWSYGIGGSVGFQWSPNEKFSVALGYTSEIMMTEFDKYRDLFAQKGGFDVPAHLDIGIAFKPTAGLSLTAGLQEIFYEGVDSVSNPIQSIFSCPTAGMGGTDLESCLGGNRGAGFGWQDMTVYSVGAAWDYGSDWTFRVGASFTDQPIPGGSDPAKSQMTFNILAPGVMEEHYTVGFTRRLGSGNELNMSFMYAPKVKVSGVQNFDPTQNVSFEMDQWDLEISYAWGK
jgi:long-chain fatty acid transport protein